MMVSVEALDRAKRSAGLNGETMPVTIPAPIGLARHVTDHRTLPAGLTFELTRMDADSVEVEIVDAIESRPEKSGAPTIEIHNHLPQGQTSVAVPAPTVTIHERPLRKRRLVRDEYGVLIGIDEEG